MIMVTSLQPVSRGSVRIVDNKGLFSYKRNFSQGH